MTHRRVEKRFWFLPNWYMLVRKGWYWKHVDVAAPAELPEEKVYPPVPDVFSPLVLCPRCGRKLRQPAKDPYDLQGRTIPFRCKNLHTFVVYEDRITKNLQLVERQAP